VQHVEQVGALADVFDQQRIGGDPVADVGVEPERPRLGGVQPGRDGGVAGGEQGDVVAQLHQRLGQLENDALGAAVMLRRDSLE
jgi:hypothetical protein